MVSYYNTTNMYRHQQAVSAPNAPMHTWYNYHHQNAHAAPSYCMQDEQQMWHHPAAHPAVFQDFPEFVHSAAGMAQAAAMQHHAIDHGSAAAAAGHQMPSPTITVSGSEMSSPGGGSGNLSPPAAGLHQAGVARPPPVRSPYEWIKKPSYQSQPNPGKTRTKDKYRVVYTDMQRIELEKEFTFNNKYITIRRKSELATSLGLSERQIKIWFQNRRAKERKQNKKRIEEKNQTEWGLVQHDEPAAMHHQLHHQLQQSLMAQSAAPQPPPPLLADFKPE